MTYNHKSSHSTIQEFINQLTQGILSMVSCFWLSPQFNSTAKVIYFGQYFIFSNQITSSCRHTTHKHLPSISTYFLNTFIQFYAYIIRSSLFRYVTRDKFSHFASINSLNNKVSLTFDDLPFLRWISKLPSFKWADFSYYLYLLKFFNGLSLFSFCDFGTCKKHFFCENDKVADKIL